MRLLLYRLYAVVAILLIPAGVSSGRNVSRGRKAISPFEYGLKKARTDIERYAVLLKTHQAAVKSGVDVDYTGIDTIKLEIPPKPLRIPLTRYNDFKGCVIVLKNTVKKCWLFGTEEKATPIDVPKRVIDTGDFRKVGPLKKGRYLLLIEDENPWVQNRRGHSYGHKRKDILLVENGVAKNAVIKPYNNPYSSPKCSYIKVKDEPWVLKNLSIVRDSECTEVTHVAAISGYNNVRIANVSLHTPTSTLTDDRGIRINNCTNVTLQDVRIDGTYSQPKHSGYGVNMNNIWNFKAIRMYGKANWGIFGNNNINTARIVDSEINRFDIHCYGRDLSYESVVFFDRYNSHSSVYGTIVYNNCTFTNFVPSQFGGSYNAFVAHNVEFNDCIFNLTPNKNYLCRPLGVTKEINIRPELTKKCLPNIGIKNMTINMTEGVEDFTLFSFERKDDLVDIFDGISTISIDGLTVNSASGTPVRYIQLSNRVIKTSKKVSISIKNVTINQPKQGFVAKMLFSNNALLKFNLPIDERKVYFSNVNNLRLE